MKALKLLLCLFSFISVQSFSQGSGSMLEFNGSSNFVNCGSVNMSGNGLTIQGWVKVDAFKANHPYISSLFGTETPGTAQAMLRLGDANISGSQVQMVIYNGSTHYKLDGSKNLSTNTWYHIAGTYDGSIMRIYINGVQDVSMSVSTSIVSNSTFQIGQHYSADRTIDGSIDEVSVFKSALSQNTIRDWMCKSITSSHPNYSSLEAYWKFDEGTGTSAADSSPSNHTGSLTNSPTWKTSEAPIGEESVHDFSTPTSLSIQHANGDTFSINSISGNPQSAHLYLVNQKPNNTTMPTGITDHDTTRYFGYFFVEGSAPRANVQYSYQNNSHYQSTATCMIDMVRRSDNSSTSWSVMNASQGGTSLTKSSQPRSEMMLVYRSNKVINSDTVGSVCTGDSVKLEHATSGLNYTWYRNGSLMSGVTGNRFYAKQDGLYQLIVGLSNCNDTSYQYRLSVDTIPTVSFDPIPGSCPSVTLDTISGGHPAGGFYQNIWIVGNLFTVQNAGPGSYKIVYFYRDANGCRDTASQTKLVYPYPGISLNQQAPVCEDSSSFNLSLTTLTGGQYFVNGTAGATFDPIALGVGAHSVRYDYTDTNGCFAQDSILASVVGLPNVQLDLTIDTLCEYDTIQVLAGGTPTGGAYSGTGVNLGLFYPSVAGIGQHAIQYQYTDTNGCSSDNTDAIEIVARPAKPTITKSGDSLIASQALSYQWYEDSIAIPGATSAIFEPDTNGIFNVRIYNELCESVLSDTVKYEKEIIIDPEPEGLAELKLAGVAVYPNPNKGSFYIENKDFEDLHFIVFDISGKKIHSDKLSREVQSLDLKLSKGLYLLHLEKADLSLVQKLVVQ